MQQENYSGKASSELSRIVLGGGSFLEITNNNLERIFAYAINNGIFRVDTSPCYADSEKKIGQVLSGSPEFKIKTKICIAENQILTKDKVISSVENSLNMLKVRKIESLHLHSISPHQVEDKALEELMNLKDSGTIERIGVSSDNLDLHEFASLNIFDSYMSTLNLIDMSNLEILKKLVELSEVKIVIKRALANGVWRQDARFRLLKLYRFLAHEIDRKNEQSYYFRHTVLSKSIGMKMSKMMYMNFAFSWDQRVEVIIGTRNTNHLREFRNLERFKRLDEMTIAHIEANWRNYSNFMWKAQV